MYGKIETNFNTHEAFLLLIYNEKSSLDFYLL